MANFYILLFFDKPKTLRTTSSSFLLFGIYGENRFVRSSDSADQFCLAQHSRSVRSNPCNAEGQASRTITFSHWEVIASQPYTAKEFLDSRAYDPLLNSLAYSSKWILRQLSGRTIWIASEISGNCITVDVVNFLSSSIQEFFCKRYQTIIVRLIIRRSRTFCILLLVFQRRHIFSPDISLEREAVSSMQQR